MRYARSLVHAALLRQRMAALTRVTGMTRVASVAAVACVMFYGSGASAAGDHNHVRDVRIGPDEAVPDGAKIEIAGTGALSYSVRVADGGTRTL